MKFFATAQRRWIIAGLLLLVTMINYTDRMTLAVLVGEVRKNLSLSETDYSQVISLFLVAYAIMYAGSGYIVDRLGTRLGMVLFVLTWSVAQMLHAAARGKWSLGACRFLLGLAEPGSFPAATKAVGEWFPAGQRAVGVGIFNAGSSLGAALAAPMAAWLGLRYGWRTAFVFTGALGLIWLIFWLMIYRPRQSTIQSRERVQWRRVLASRKCLTLIAARFLSDPVIYFIIFWFPAYLAKERGFDLKKIGEFAWMPYVFGDVGYIFGGWLSGRFMRAGKPVAQARKIAMGIGAALLPLAIFAPWVSTAGIAIAITCVVVFGHAIWISNLMTLPVDLFPPFEVGTAAGFSGMGGAIGGALASLAIGSVITHFSYAPMFVWAGLMHPLAFLLIWHFLRKSDAAPDYQPA